MKALIVDNSPLIRTRLLDMLSSYEEIERIFQASSILRSINKINKYKPNLIIMELSLPDGSGFDILNHIRRENLKVVVLVLTLLKDEVYEKSCLDLGAVKVLDKSKDLKELKESLNNLLEYSRRKQIKLTNNHWR